MVENSWRGGQLDEKGKIRYGWGNVADTFMEDPRWTDYITEVRRGDNPSLTWKQYTAALEYQRLQPSSHQEQHWTHHLVRSQREQQSQGPQSQAPRWMEGATRAATATSALPYVLYSVCILCVFPCILENTVYSVVFCGCILQIAKYG